MKLWVERRTAAGDDPISTIASRPKPRGTGVSRFDVSDRLIRTNPVYYRPVHRLVQQLGSMDRDARRAMSQQLTQRTLRWAEKTDAGVPARITLLDRPFIEKAQLRDRPDAYQVRGAIRVDASTSGSSGLPVRLQRSLRCIASEQAFLDSLLTEQQLTFHTARVARLRADRIKSVNDREPPYGVESADGRLMKLSPNHLGPDTAQWFCDALRRFAPDLLYTNPSHVEKLAAFVRENDLTLPIPLVVTTSETLDSNGRALIEEAFGATVIDYYGQAERVVFAAASPDDGYYFNPAYGRVELFPDDHVAAPPGYRAFDIVGTGFWNDATPLVRFRTDDYALVPDDYGDAELEDVALGLRPVHTIQGRGKTYLVSPRGEVLEGLTTFSDGVDGLIRLQIIQDALDSVRILTATDPRVGRLDTARLLSNARRWVPDDMRVKVEEIGGEFECLPSGKAPFVIHRFKDPWDPANSPSPSQRGERSAVEWFDLFADTPPTSATVTDVDRVRIWLAQNLTQPDPALGRPGPICPYIAQSISKRMLWVGRVTGPAITKDDMIAVVDDVYDLYQQFMRSDGHQRDHRAILTVFTQLHDTALIDEIQALRKTQFVERGLMLGQFYPGCPHPGLWNPNYHPLDAPAAMLVVRTMVATDYPFLTDRADWFEAYITRFAPGLPKPLRSRIVRHMTRTNPPPGINQPSDPGCR